MVPDIFVRIYAEHLSKALGQAVFVDNRLGVSGVVGTESALRMADEHTFMYGFKLVSIDPLDAAAVQLVHVPYKQSALPDVIAGRVPMVFEPMASAVPFVRAGNLKALAVTTAKRLSVLPEIATMSETIPGFGASLHGLAMRAELGGAEDNLGVLSLSLMARCVANPLLGACRAFDQRVVTTTFPAAVLASMARCASTMSSM